MKNTKRIAKNLHTFARAEIVLAMNQYYPSNDNYAMKIKFKIMHQKWSCLSKKGKQYFIDKAILILTK